MDAIESARASLFPNLELKKEQLLSITNAIEGKDTIVSLPVGDGKSLIYQILPQIFENLRKPSKVIVVSPLNAIIKDQLERLCELRIPAVGLDVACHVMNDDRSAFDAAADCSIILCHPEALFTEEGQKLLISLHDKVSTLVVDECHKIEEWGMEFRKSFMEVAALRSFFPKAPFICLSGTIPLKNVTFLCNSLNLQNPVIISKSPDKNNIYFEIHEKEKGNITTVLENIYIKEIEKLKEEGNGYPVTLMFMPLQHMSQAMRYAKKLLNSPSIEDSLYAALFSSQDPLVNNHIYKQLGLEDPHLRLIFCTSIVGMGFDSPCVSQVIHLKPPRNLSNYMQEVGRAGRRGQEAKAIMYYNKSDIASNVPGIQKDIVELCSTNSCFRECILKYFGFSKDENSPIGCSCCNVCLKTCLCEKCNSL